MKQILSQADRFVSRHNGPGETEIKEMLKVIGVDSLQQLVDETVPADIRLQHPLSLPDGVSEFEHLHHLKNIAAKNKIFKSYLGLGYYDCIVPAVIQRNIFENPGWYTQYTPSGGDFPGTSGSAVEFSNHGHGFNRDGNRQRVSSG